MSFLAANPDLDRLASRAIQTGLAKRTQSLPVQPPQLERPFGQMESNPGYYLGEQLATIPERHAVLAPFGRYLSALGEDDNNHAALLGALGGAGLGAGVGYLRGDNPLIDAGVGAGVGGLGSYLIGNAMAKHRHNQEAQRAQETEQAKTSSFYAMNDDENSDAMQDIQSKVFSDYSASVSLKSEVLRILQQLDPRRLSEVHSLVRASAGAGIAFLLARYLLGLGMGGSTLMALIGGGLGAMSGGAAINAFGQRSDPTRNVFGEHRLV